ncbi:MAG TPA: hypothetical protein P5110_04780, partial [Candidatus Omnitrophota bacterium]|nr:hypothetical protein [Candidatus Omnitrophota bacterium]
RLFIRYFNAGAAKGVLPVYEFLFYFNGKLGILDIRYFHGFVLWGDKKAELRTFDKDRGMQRRGKNQCGKKDLIRS